MSDASHILNPALKFMDPKFVEVNINFADFFHNSEIEVLGAWEEPMFNAMDVAKFVKDHNYIRTIKTIVPEKYRVEDSTRAKNNIYLKESGLYEYLFACRTDAASKFRAEVADALCKLRIHHTVTLKNKLDDAVLQIVYMENTIAKTTDQRNLAVAEKIWISEKSKMQDSKYNIKYFQTEPDNTYQDMFDHYINYWIYEYKYVVYTDDTFDRMLPPTFTFDDIPQCEVYNMYRQCKLSARDVRGNYDDTIIITLGYKLVEKFLQPYKKIYDEYHKDYPFLFNKRHIRQYVPSRKYYQPGNSIFDDDN